MKMRWSKLFLSEIPRVWATDKISLRHEAKWEKISVIWEWKLYPICIDSAQSMLCDNEEDLRSNLGKPFQASITLNLHLACLQGLCSYIWNWPWNLWTGALICQEKDHRGPNGWKVRGETVEGRQKKWEHHLFPVVLVSTQRTDWFSWALTFKWLSGLVHHHLSILGLE